MCHGIGSIKLNTRCGGDQVRVGEVGQVDEGILVAALVGAVEDQVIVVVDPETRLAIYVQLVGGLAQDDLLVLARANALADHRRRGGDAQSATDVAIPPGLDRERALDERAARPDVEPAQHAEVTLVAA